MKANCFLSLPSTYQSPESPPTGKHLHFCVVEISIDRCQSQFAVVSPGASPNFYGSSGFMDSVG